MIQTEQELTNEAARRESFEKLEVNGEIPVGHTKSEMPLSREKRDEIAEQQEAELAGTNPIKSGSN